MKVDNKKLVKVLVISGVTLLFGFIIIRLALKNGGDRITDMPTIGELQYKPKKVKEESKVEQFEEQKKENDRKTMGYEDQKSIVIPNFNNLIDKNGNEPAEKANEKNTRSVENKISNSSNGYKPIQIHTNQNNNSGSESKLNYHSDYFKSNNEPAEQQVKEQETSIVNKNPFGTISNDNAQGSKDLVAPQTGYYTAEIYGDQKIFDGGVVLIRNTSSMQYLNISIPKNSILYGQASFRGNRVYVSINRAKTMSGEFSVGYSVRDNDKIDGLYYKAPIDETVDKSKEDVNVPSIPIPGQYGQVINSVTQSVVKGGKELMKKSASLKLEEGYKLYLVQK